MSDCEDKSAYESYNLSGEIAASSAGSSTARVMENTQTTVKTFVEANSEILVDDAPSETMSVPSDGSQVEGNLRVPDVPASGLDKRAFECPYCFEIMKVSSNSSWR